MFQLEKINGLFDCKVCKSVLVDPIILPCGETVCKGHMDQTSQGKCLLCTEIHISPQGGFPSNKIVKNQLDLEINKINLDFSQFNEYHDILRELNENFNEIEAIRKDPENYIFEYFGELTIQVDLRRETLIEDIHNYSDELIQEKIEKLKKDCVAKSKEARNITKDLATIKVKMNELNSAFNSLQIDDTKLNEIMSKQKSKELSQLMGPVLKRYKFKVQGKKYHKLLTNKIKLEDAFGSLGCFVNETDNIYVNTVCCLQLSFL